MHRETVNASAIRFERGEIRLKRDAVEWREVDGEIVVLDMNAAEYLRANSGGVTLWPALAEGTTRDALVDQLLDTHDIDRETAERDVDAFLEALAQRGVLDDRRPRKPAAHILELAAGRPSSPRRRSCCPTCAGPLAGRSAGAGGVARRAKATVSGLILGREGFVARSRCGDGVRGARACPTRFRRPYARRKPRLG